MGFQALKVYLWFSYSSPVHTFFRFAEGRINEAKISLRLKIAQKPYVVWSLGPKALKDESLEPLGFGSVQGVCFGALGVGQALSADGNDMTWEEVRV